MNYSSRISSLVSSLFILITFALLIASRFYAADIRPLHHDEGVNHLFIQNIDRDGYYQYSHENYHGPTYFYLTWASWKVFGDTEMGMRAGVGFVSILTILLVALLMRTTQRWLSVGAAVVLGVSPVVLYYSRYSIHETLFVAFIVGVALTSYRWLMTPLFRHAVIGGLFLGLAAATKETYIISLAAIGLGMLCAEPKRIFTTETSLRAACISFGLFLAVLVLLFIVSVAFTWNQGIAEVITSIPQWVGRNSHDNGHFKPWYYYLSILAWTEWSTSLLVVVTIPIAAMQWSQPAFSQARFLWGWGGATLCIYSALNYKMPWLFLNAAVPLILAGVETLSFAKKPFFAPAVLVLATVLGAYKGYITSFKASYGDPSNPFAYVHTLEGTKSYISDLKKYIQHQRNGKPTRILVGVDGYWPLPFYFKQLENEGLSLSIAYESFVGVVDAGRLPFKEFDVVMTEASYDKLAGPFNLEKVRGYEDVEPSKLQQWSESYYRLADHEDCKVFYRLEGNDTP